MDSTSKDASATFRFDPPERIANWRPGALVAGDPHLVIVNVLQTVAEVLAIVSWFVILFTGKLPPGLATFQAMYLRYTLRTATYFGFLREEYPPFGFATVNEDPEMTRRCASRRPQLVERNRLTTAFRLILAIRLVVLALLGIAVFVVGIIAFFAVLSPAAGRLGCATSVLGVGRWWLRVQAYLLLLTDDYPPFPSSDQTHTRGSVAARPPRRVAPTAGPIHPGAPRAQFSAGGRRRFFVFVAPLNRSGPRQSVERFDAPSADGLSSRSPIMASLAIGRRRLEPSRGTGSSRASVGTVRSGGSGVAPWTSRRSPQRRGDGSGPRDDNAEHL